MSTLIQRFQQLGTAGFAETIFHQGRPLARALMPIYVTALQAGQLTLHLYPNKATTVNESMATYERSAVCVIADLAAELLMEASLSAGLKARLQAMTIEYLNPTLKAVTAHASVNVAGAAAGTQHTVTVEFFDVQGLVVCRATLSSVISGS